jgi:quercetin dioxygenase-like cupin family protein
MQDRTTDSSTKTSCDARPDHTFGYVLEGAYKIKLDNGPATVMTKGQTFYEAPGQLHAVSRNASDIEPAKVLVVMLAEAGKPVTVPERP